MRSAVPKYHLLVVEDNAVNQKLAMRLLEKMGYHVDVASNGQEAVDCCMTQRYDLVLMDCQMPVMDGFEATCAIRCIPCDVPILALTGSAMPEDRALCLSSGMNDCLSKPINFAQLDLILKKWLSSVPVRNQEQITTPSE